jgi:hypothetical protein
MPRGDRQISGSKVFVQPRHGNYPRTVFGHAPRPGFWALSALPGGVWCLARAFKAAIRCVSRHGGGLYCGSAVERAPAGGLRLSLRVTAASALAFLSAHSRFVIGAAFVAPTRGHR